MSPPSSANPTGTPAAEIEINATLVRALLAEQHPDLASRPLRVLASGWDNAIFRLGDQYSVRLPRRAAAAELIRHEQRWLPMLAERLPIPIPAPVRLGRPGCGYPWCWSVLPWLPGVTADLSEPGAHQAEPLADFLCALHTDAAPGAPHNPARGVALEQRAASVEARLRRLDETSELVTEDVWRTWKLALNAPLDVAPTWIHGDLHARNVLVQDESITAILDWGDIATGDRATDLASIWMLLPDLESRQRAIRACVPLSEATWLRARGWAILFGAVLLDTGLVDHPGHALMGARTLQRISTGP